jgi:endonuclease/exonuclease/phosphatase (EEP) superfamily protein YafD
MRGGRFSRVFWVLTGLNLSALVAVWLLERVLAERHWLVTVMAYVPQHPIGLVTVALMVWALMARDLRGFAANLPALALFAFFFMGLNLPWRAMLAGKPDGVPLRVVTYNIQDDSASLASMRALKPDVICAQESDALEDPHLGGQSLISGYAAVTDDELTVISRYPIRSHRVVRFPRSQHMLSEAVLDVGGVPVTVINIHIWTLDIQGRFPNYADLSLKDRVTRFSTDRWEAVEKLLALAGEASGPVIVCGDFNLPPRGALYNALRARLDDAFAVAGWGLGFTYRADVPMLRIDYVWTTDRLRATQSFVLDDRVSDHRALVADLVLGP